MQLGRLAVYPECDVTEFRCGNQRCVPLDYVCDGDDDCRDGSDERDCGAGACGGGHRCRSGQCLWEALVCNGVWDCPDGSDEANCSELPPKTRLRPAPPSGKRRRHDPGNLENNCVERERTRELLLSRHPRSRPLGFPLTARRTGVGRRLDACTTLSGGYRGTALRDAVDALVRDALWASQRQPGSPVAGISAFCV